MHRGLACALTILHGFGDVLWQPWRAENYSFLRMRGNSDAQKGAACSYVTLYVRGAMLALPTRSSGERRTHSSEWEGTQTPEREWHAHRWPSMVRGTMLALPTMLRRERHAHWWHSMVRGAMLVDQQGERPMTELWGAENSFLRMRGNSDAQKGVACS